MSENQFRKVDIESYHNRIRVSRDFWSSFKRGIIICNICERRCHIPPNFSGLCGNYVNFNECLYDIGYGQLSAIESRPIEIKPLFHFYPNSTALTFSGWGCNFHCPWCQNYHLSMVRPLPKAKIVTPEEVVNLAIKKRDDGLCASFNEPTIHLTFLLDSFELARKEGLYNTMVSNGYMTKNVINALIKSGIDGLNIDIKGCPKSHKQELRGINPDIIFRNAKIFLNNNIHVEMVFLVVTDYNDDPECIKWILNKHIDVLGPDVPLHINRYYPAYKYGKPATKLNTLLSTYEMARELGIKYVYVGNIWDPKYETTYCPRCNMPLIIRMNYRVVELRLDGDRCRRCGEKIYLMGKVLAA